MNIKHNPLLQKALQLQQAGDLASAEKLLRKLQRDDPDNTSINLQLGCLLIEAAAFNEAEQFLRRAYDSSPDEEDVIFNLSIALQEQGNNDEALTMINRLLQKNANHGFAWFIKGVIFFDQAQFPEAAIANETACRLLNNFPQAFLNQGLILAELERLDEAIPAYRKAIEIMPGYTEAHYNLGHSYEETRQFDLALKSYQQTISLDPLYLDAWIAASNCYKSLGAYDKALSICDEALDVFPENPDLFYQKGAILASTSDYQEAIRHFEQCLALAPQHHKGLASLGTVFLNNCSYIKAVEVLEKAVQLCPGNAAYLNNLGIAYQSIAKFKESFQAFEKAIDLEPTYLPPLVNILYSSNYAPDKSEKEIYASCRRWNDVVAANYEPKKMVFDNPRTTDRKLHIGYLSPDFRDSVCDHYIRPILENHDRTRFKISLYSAVAQEDHITEIYKTKADHWHDINILSDDEAADLIKENNVDILVDLAGHVAGSRILVFARKPAPVQITWLGYGYTTGLDTMDYFLADKVFVPEGSDALFSEALWYLPRISSIYRPPENTPDVTSSPFLDNGHITFGSLTRPIRLNQRVISVWSEILKRVPSSKLALDYLNFDREEEQAAFAARFAEQGVSQDRLIFRHSPSPWAGYQKIDIALDPFPQNAGATTHEALWMGVPVLTLAGRPALGRLGASILTPLGLENWIARSEQDYIDKAVSFAGDRDNLIDLRNRLRDVKKSSAFADEQSFVKDLEEAFIRMWGNWCEKNDA